MTTNQVEFLPSLFRTLESWSTLVRHYFSHLWDSIHASFHGDPKSALCVVFGRWRSSAPKEEVIAEIIDVVQATKDPDLIEGLGVILQKACLDPGILLRLKRIAYCAKRIDKLHSGTVLYALRAERESKGLLAGVMSPQGVTCRAFDILKHVRAELLDFNGGSAYRLLWVMRELEASAIEEIRRDPKLSVEEKRHLREEMILANSIAYASWAESQVSLSTSEPAARGYGGQTCLALDVH